MRAKTSIVYTLWLVGADTTLSLDAFRILDANAPHFGVPLTALMSNAGQACAEEAQKRFHPRRVLIVCGPGNNGGDGLAMASLLAKSAEVRVLLSGSSSELRTREARWAHRRLDPARIPVETYRDAARFRELAKDADLIVDALLGSGLAGPLREPVRTLVRLINASRRPVLSVDVPTGYEGALAVKPAVTVALHDKKKGMTTANSGRIVVRDIGIPTRATEEVGPGDFTVPYRRNSPHSHKGQNGRLLVVAGGPYGGAPILAARAAARSGIDLVRLYTPAEVSSIAQAAQPDLIVHPGLEPRRLVPEDALRLRSIYERVDALLIGPGLGADPKVREAVERILKDAAARSLPTVLDADAIGVAGDDPKLARRLRPLVTPHHGEFLEFTGRRIPNDATVAARLVKAQAARLRSTLLVKGPTDLISDGKHGKRNTFHHPAMTTGGTGDVLAGLCGGFLAKGMPPFQAACAATFVNGAAGVRAARRQGGTLVASDLVREIPRVFRAFLR